MLKEIHKRLKPLLEKEPEFGGDMRRSEESSELSGDEDGDESEEDTIRTDPPATDYPATGPPTTGPPTAAPYPRPNRRTSITSITNRLHNIITRTPTNPDGTEVIELPTPTPYSRPRRTSIMKRFRNPFSETPHNSGGIEIAELAPQNGLHELE
ncbi:hypothetical protein GP486_008346 [Trichoglossum hirsutum]|uniref:Uncharacterized protein n=1 Tax=Trichoglossum hirsutum TaxID=265104 RepID=A0A9P8IA30_9PEZI|nr:hypothetical protein GP486_008346 [Trichoglossum hirsutum]